MTLSLAQNAIALLIDLAERGEINPWDVQVIEVIDRFLSKLQPVVTRQAGRAPYEADLSESGQAFLYASMLLLLKADSLARLEIDQDPSEPPEEFLEDAIGIERPLLLNLERQIRRRATAPPVQRRQVTLQELIAQLNLIATAMADPKPRRVATRRARPQTPSQAMRAIAQLAHEEDLSEIAAVLEQFLAAHWQQGGQGEQQDWLEFEKLLDFWAMAQVQPDTGAEATIHDRVGVFWALLFLSAQSKVELSQDQFYQDLQVRSFTPADQPVDQPVDQPAVAPPLD
ncbi:MAG: segregation/condensation protein A [Pegethrix bostrychoides GSE-TBD4-15B]|jgi:segregation and condensation protein A|uniref:Segregation and condensation protein A n=1 Tax=Pegethrix bostrychoides GSE-TBD4-15B TaxID=2839662 RepID=A0A951U379_9CYAN|nr:segregation/condensation protein A [Pegethrix bostrychoides GSE-TBD4-15B]